MNLTKSNSTDAVSIPNALKKWILSLKDFWKHWGDKSTKDWSVLTIDNFDDFLMDGTGPQTQSVHASTMVPPTTGTMTPAMDVNVITSALSAAMLTKPPSSHTDVFMKNKGGGDDVKALKEAKQWNPWNCSFLSVVQTYDVTDPSYVPDISDSDTCSLFEAQQKHAFGILVSTIKESSALPVLRKYSDPKVLDYGNAQLLYTDLVTHFTQGLTGKQCLEKRTKTCEAFLNLVDNKLKDHQGIAPDPAQYPDTWYINHINHTIETHTTLYQYVVNHQMQADSIAKHAPHLLQVFPTSPMSK